MKSITILIIAIALIDAFLVFSGCKLFSKANRLKKKINKH
jgi:hypothetical protein